MKRLLALDLSNLCYMGAVSANKAEVAAEVYYESALKFLRTQYRYFKPDHVVFACDHESPYWRNTLYQDYKGNRQDNAFKQKVREVIKRFKAENAHLCIEYPGCEADDVIYALCQYTGFHVTIVSSDGDFEQLMTERVRVFNPSRFSFRLKPPDVAFNLFVKCIRGDRGDNIPSALPMVTLKRLRQAYEHSEPAEYLEKHYRFSPEFRMHYQRNRTLIDLREIPEHLKIALKEKIVTYFKTEI